MMRLRPLLVLVVLVLLAAACGSDSNESSESSESSETAATTEVTAEASEADTPAEEVTEEPSAEPTEAPAAGDGVGRATLTIGEENWSFDQVTLCTTGEQDDPTVSFVTLIIEDPWQFVGQVIDPTGERRLEGDGVYDEIDFQNIVDGTQGIWVASGAETGEQYFEINGLEVTAEANFDDFRTTEIEETPGTLEAVCP